MARGKDAEDSLAKRARPAPVSSRESDAHIFRRQQHQDQIADGRRRSSYLRCEAIPSLSGNPGPGPNDALPQDATTSDDPASTPACQVGVADLIFDIQRLSPDQISQARTEIERILRQNEAANTFLPPHAQQQSQQHQQPEHQQRNLASLVSPNALSQNLAPRVHPQRKQVRSRATPRKSGINKAYLYGTPIPESLPVHVAPKPDRHVSFSLKGADDALQTPEGEIYIPPKVPMSNSTSKGKQKADVDQRDNPENRHLFQFRADDAEAFEKFCETTFNDLQQLAMKTILKAWIKELEPKKQKRYPYCRTQQTGRYPSWWPIAKVPHREPDHLSKLERSILAMTILRWVIRPDFESRGIDRLEESTRSHKLVYDKDKADRPEHRQRVLKQLYEVVRKRQMFERDEMDGDVVITVSHLYREPGRKRYRHRVRNQGTVELSPPPLETSSQDQYEGEDQVMLEKQPPPPPSFQFDQTGQPTPISMSEEPSMGRDELFDQHSAVQSFSPGGAPESPYLEHPIFRPQQMEQFSPNTMYRADYPERQVQQQPPGLQQFQAFESHQMDWQQPAIASMTSPVTSQSSSNANYKPPFEEAEVSWNNPQHVASLPISPLQPTVPHDINNPSVVASNMQERSPGSYQMGDARLPMQLDTMGPIQERYHQVAVANGMMQSFDASARPNEVFPQHQQRNSFAQWPSTAATQQPQTGWQQTDYATNPHSPY